MDVASLPAPANKSSKKLQTRRDTYRRLVKRGFTATEIAKKLAPDDARRRKIIRGDVRYVIAHDEEIQAMRAASIKGAFYEELDGVAEAVGRRARRGRIDAAKLMLEVTGIHNPRVKHEHSGDIKITLDLPRPPRQVDELSAGESFIPDVDVVEE